MARKCHLHFATLFTLICTEIEAEYQVCVMPKPRMHGVFFSSCVTYVRMLNIRSLVIEHAYRVIWYATYFMRKRTKPSFFFLFLVKEQSFPCCRISCIHGPYLPCHPQAQKFSSVPFNKNTQTHPHSSTFLPETEKAFSLLLQPLFVSLSN
jgi:hypothetical protein